MNYLTADKIRVVGRFSIQNIKEIEINAKTNEHPTIYVKGIIPADIGMEEIKDKCFKERIALVELDEEGKEKDYAIFDGIILNAEVKEEGNFFEVEIWGISASYLFDIEKKSRSFQNVSMTYSDILKEVIGEHKYIFTSGEDRKIGKPLIQYNETDWEFARRLASHFNKPIQSDIITGNPGIWFGIRLGNQPEKEYERLFHTNTYSVEISNKYYEVGEPLGLSKLHYILYKVKNGRNFHIGDKVLFQDKKLIICEKEVKFEKGELVFYYTLARENYLSVIEYYNTGFTGLSLLGEIIKTENETVYLKLDIDGKNGEYSYKWTPTSGSLMYCMPKVGTKASLYFSSADERSGIATNSPRTNGGIATNSSKTNSGSNSQNEVANETFSDVQERGMVTEHGKRMDLYPDVMRFSATGEVDEETGEIIKPLELLFDDESGIIAESNKNLSLIALKNIKIESNQNSTFQAPILLNVLRSNRYIEQLLDKIVPVGTYTMATMLNEEKQQIEYTLVPDDTTLVLNNRIDFYSYKNIVFQARVYESHEAFDDAPREGKKSFFGMALVVIGTIATVALAGAAIVASGALVVGALMISAVFTVSATINIFNNVDNYNSWGDFFRGLGYLTISALDGASRGLLLGSSITGLGPLSRSLTALKSWGTMSRIGIGMQLLITSNQGYYYLTEENKLENLIGKWNYMALDISSTIMCSPAAMAGLISEFSSTNAKIIGEIIGVETGFVDDAAKLYKPKELMEELANSGVKYNVDDVILVTKNPNGSLMWLEQGNIKSGLIHILEGHTDDFIARGIDVDDIPKLLKEFLESVPANTGKNTVGLFAEYITYNGKKYRVAYGTNGYVVSFFPIK